MSCPRACLPCHSLLTRMYLFLHHHTIDGLPIHFVNPAAGAAEKQRRHRDRCPWLAASTLATPPWLAQRQIWRATSQNRFTLLVMRCECSVGIKTNGLEGLSSSASCQKFHLRHHFVTRLMPKPQSSHLYRPLVPYSQVQQYMDLLGAHAEELIRQGRNTGNDEDDTEEYGAVLRAGLQSLQRVRGGGTARKAGMTRPLRHRTVSQLTCMPCFMVMHHYAKVASSACRPLRAHM